jgi:hypothetical protein
MYSAIHVTEPAAPSVEPLRVDSIVRMDYAFRHASTLSADVHHFAFANTGKHRHEPRPHKCAGVANADGRRKCGTPAAIDAEISFAVAALFLRWRSLRHSAAAVHSGENVSQPALDTGAQIMVAVCSSPCRQATTGFSTRPSKSDTSRSACCA